MKAVGVAAVMITVLAVLVVGGLLLLGGQIDPSQRRGIGPALWEIEWCHDNTEAVLAAAVELGYGEEVSTSGPEFSASCSKAYKAR